MISYIALAATAAVILYGVSHLFNKVENVVKAGTTKEQVVKVFNTAGDAAANTLRSTPKRSPRIVASIVTPVVAFVALAGVVAVVAPPASEFTTSNVAWDSRDGGVLGATSDAVIVRTVGADVQPGFLYSTATLSGNEYVSIGGGAWVCTGAPGSASVVGMLWIAVIAALAFTLAYVGLREAPASRTPAAALTL